MDPGEHGEDGDQRGDDGHGLLLRTHHGQQQSARLRAEEFEKRFPGLLVSVLDNIYLHIKPEQDPPAADGAHGRVRRSHR